MKTIRRYLSRNDIKTLAKHFNVADFTVQRALLGYPSELCKNIRAFALNIVKTRFEEFQKDLPEFEKEFQQSNQ